MVAALYLESMSSAVHGETRVFVMAVTASPLRLYLFMGGPTLEVGWGGVGSGGARWGGVRVGCDSVLYGVVWCGALLCGIGAGRSGSVR